MRRPTAACSKKERRGQERVKESGGFEKGFNKQLENDRERWLEREGRERLDMSGPPKPAD